ncbi:calcium-binding protein [Aureimonas psammosilenae]|uniref:calcium-binding protein n=1 Tax=Aureimonas psammosilenae TaxID=2495496 RepID=UPI001260F5DF|nr:cadherin-like domain-containing protein [Aureimonas psammosilenae]
MTTFTTTSPTSKGALPTGVTEIGGLVLDLVGLNGVRIVSQISASSLYEGYPTTTPVTIGTQSGFDAATIAALGGGLKEAAVRVTLYDGDSAAGDFDFHDNGLLLNGINFGDCSNVSTQVTTNDGKTGSSIQNGFPDDRLATGWFSSTDASVLKSFYDSLTSKHAVTFGFLDKDVNDNQLNFKQGLAGNLIDIGKPPVPVNQAPVIDQHTLSPVLGACDTHARLGADDLHATDAEGAALTYTVTAASVGTLLVNGEIAGVGTHFTQSDIDAGRVTLYGGAVQPAANGTFSDSFHFSVSDGVNAVAGSFDAAYAGFDNVQTQAQWGGYWGGSGKDYLLGTNGADNMSGGDGCDTLIGNKGDDNLHAGEGNNRVFGGEGRDNLTGGNGNDLLDGGADDDQISGNGGNNILFGGAGNDRITANDGNDVVFGGDGNDQIDVNGGNNRVNGGAGNDRITTGNGNDTIVAGAGDDVVYANGGNNKIQLGGVSGAVSDGNDQFWTGNGADKFALFLEDRDGKAAGFGNDTINGFRIAEGDQLLAFNSKAGFWDNKADLASITQNGFVSGARSADGGDLTLFFAKGQANESSVTLKWFFWDNGQFLSNDERSTAFGQYIAADKLAGILEDVMQDGSSVGVSGTDFVAKGLNYVAGDFHL